MAAVMATGGFLFGSVSWHGYGYPKMTYDITDYQKSSRATFYMCFFTGRARQPALTLATCAQQRRMSWARIAFVT